MKKYLNLAAATFVSASLVFTCALTLSKQASAAQTPIKSSSQNTSDRLIAQSCSNIEIRPNRNQDLSFRRGTRWVTNCTRFRLEFQTDGNLALYNSSGRAIWATGTEGRGATLQVQGDGNVVLYDSNNRPIWATDTDRNSGAFLSVQTDGNLVLYRSDRRPIWATGTDGGKRQTVSAGSNWLASRQPQTSPSQQSPFVQRAKAWVDGQIPYNQGLTANPDGSRAGRNTGYRMDCSGFISMAWGVPATGLTVPVTGNLGNYANTFSNKDQLQPGDAINNRQVGNDGHVVMFVRWINQNQGKFVAYEQNGGHGKTLETNLTLVSNNQGWTIQEYGRGPWVFQRKK
jgi:hypothetical protein